jgi:hypothetical protein
MKKAANRDEPLSRDTRPVQAPRAAPRIRATRGYQKWDAATTSAVGILRKRRGRTVRKAKATRKLRMSKAV